MNIGMPGIGQKVPTFKLPRDGGEIVSLGDYAGRKIALFFYPKDDTSGCTAESIAFSDSYDEFLAAGTVVLGLSRDSVKKHEKFRDKHGLRVPLLSDEDAAVCTAFGVWKEKSMYGRKYMGIERSTFLIGPDGTLLAEWRKVKVPGHVDEVLAAAKTP